MAKSTNKSQIHAELDDPVSLEAGIEPSKTTSAEAIERQIRQIMEEGSQNGLEQIIITQDIFDQIKQSLNEAVKNMERNPSLFSRVAGFWGKLPLWQKILGGVALTIPTLIIGIAAHIGFLLAICGVTAVTYTATGLIFDNHNQCSTTSIESLQRGIIGLADLLELTISALDTIRKKLVAEINRFVGENERLSENINSLSEQITDLDRQVSSTAQICEEIDQTKAELEEVADSLKGNVARQTDLLEQNQHKLARITSAYQISQAELDKKISEITELKHALQKEIKNAELTISALQALVTELSNAALGDEQQRLNFQERFEQFMNDKDARFDTLLDRMFDVERKLALVQGELEKSNARYHELLGRQAEQIERLAQVVNQKKEQADSIGTALIDNGLFKEIKLNENNSKVIEHPNLQPR